jgi:acyl-coenzyme A synthetase/AMP-(fatty) acid ligase
VSAKAGRAHVPVAVYVADAVPRNENGKAQRRSASAAVAGIAPHMIARS